MDVILPVLRIGRAKAARQPIALTNDAGYIAAT
jgi:hypothetical protein